MWPMRLEMSARGVLNLRLKVFLKEGAGDESALVLFSEKGGIFSLLLDIGVKVDEREWKWRRYL